MLHAPLSWPLVDWPALGRHGGSSGPPAPIDAVVIGSGYGGSVAALRLAEQGQRVVVLERGSEFLPGDFPNHFGQLPKYLRAHAGRGTVGSLGGHWDVRAGPGLVSLVGNGLGGGSLINAGVMMRPDAEVFAQAAWPGEIRCAQDARQQHEKTGAWLGLDAAFDRAAAMLGGERYRDRGAPPGQALSQLPKAQALKRIGEVLRDDAKLRAADRRWHRMAKPGETGFEARAATVTIDLARCTRCGDCFTGCNVPGAKKTLAATYLAAAHAAGAEIVTRSLVYSLRPAAGLWQLCVIPNERGNHARRLADVAARFGMTLFARTVVVAAGAFGSTELLLRSHDLAGREFELSPALGTRLSGNGDSLTVLADLPERVGAIGHGADTLGAPADVGPTITSVLDLRGHPDLDQRLVIEEGATPGALRPLYAELLATTWTLRHLGIGWRTPHAHDASTEPLAASDALAEHTQMLLTMGHDGSAGRIVWVADMDGAVPYWIDPHRAATHRRQQQVFDAAGRGSGGVHLHTPLWRALGPELEALAAGTPQPATALTVHPLGGCPMGDSFQTGVVDHLGRVRQSETKLWPGLYVLDGAIVPTSLGCNPLWTITALAERAMAYRVLAGPARASPPRPPCRLARPLARAASPAFDVVAFERLEKRQLRLGDALRGVLGITEADCDLRVRMRAADWSALWQSADHRIDRVSGRLRLVAAQGPARRLEYRIAGGSIDLLVRPAVPALVAPLLRFEAFARALLTWALLRGRRDWREPREHPLRWRDRYTFVRVLWQAAETRAVRYDLRLELSRAQGAADPPPRLRLRATKHLAYAASWWQIARRLLGAQDDLRPSLLQQLTEPVVRLDDGRTLAALAPTWLAPAWLAGSTQARFEFDQQQALQRSPLQLLAGGDSSSAIAALLAYPAFVARWVLQARLLDFRRPEYSGKPVVDMASPRDVALRIESPCGARLALLPEEIALQVRRGRSSSDDGSESSALLTLRLWRYRRIDLDTGEPLPPHVSDGRWCELPVRRAKSVLLMHAFDMSGYTYTFKETKRNFAEHLYGQGWEVWILDSRMSPRTRASAEPSTVDQLGLIDAPAAVDRMLAELAAELPAGSATPLQVFAFGQCMGAAALLIGLLGGRLSHAQTASAPYASRSGELPRLPKLAALVTSQVHPFMVGSRDAQSRTWIPALLRDLAGRTRVPLAVRGVVASAIEAGFEARIEAGFETVVDRVFAGLPVPAGEHCPDEGSLRRKDDDDCVTCRRIRFLLGGLFLHANLNRCTHEALPKLFGAGSVRLFAQGAKFLDYERLCSEDGINAYATDEAMGRYLALPLRFVHGEKNAFFDRESATWSAERYARVHPGWSERFGLRGRSGKRRVADLLEGQGHLDALIGARAMEPAPGRDGIPGPSPYERLNALLDMAWAERETRPAPPRAAAAAGLAVRLPKAGPVLGPVETTPQGQRRLPLAFVIDDLAADTQAASPREGACVLVWRRDDVRPCIVQALAIERLPIALPARDGYGPGDLASGHCTVGLRVAHGAILLPEGAGRGLRIECLSYTHGAGQAPGLAALEQAVRRIRQRAAKLRAKANRPFPGTLSNKLREPPESWYRRTRIDGRVLAELAGDAPVRIAIGCCRYGGFPFDRDERPPRERHADDSDRLHSRAADLVIDRADDALRRLSRRLRDDGDAGAQLLLMLGDQIYADRSAGLADPLSAAERYLYRHQQVFSSPAIQRLVSSLPTICLPDDHEFIDAYPLGRPLFLGEADEANYAGVRELRTRELATRAVQLYQWMHMPPSLRLQGHCRVDRGGLRLFILDTRVSRRVDANGNLRTFTAAARTAFLDWLAQGRTDDRLYCLVTASVILPGLVPGSDPANAGAVDTLQASPDDRRWLLQSLIDAVPGRFVLLSGDYHLSFAGEVETGGRTVGAAIVAPPFFAPLPYANAQPADLWLRESVPLISGGSVSVRRVAGQDALPGSGYGMLTARRNGGGWRVELETALIDYEGAPPAANPPQRTLHHWPPIDLQP